LTEIFTSGNIKRIKKGKGPGGWNL